MRKNGSSWSFDSRDLLRSKCLHCTRLATARELKLPGLQQLLDEFYEKPDNLAIRYGNRFESELESELIANLGDQVQQPLERSMAATLELMDRGVPVIYQGVLRGGSGAMDFSGRPDFLLRSDYRFEFTDRGLSAQQVDGWSGGYTAWDAKLSTTAKPEYQNQVGLYVDVLRELELAAPRGHGLLLGSRELAEFNADVLLAQMIEERNRYLKQVFDFLEEDPQRIEEIGELICDASSYCLICEYPALCQDQRLQTNHLQLVFGITKNQIDSLRRSGIKTVAELAEFTGPAEKLTGDQLERLSRQARLQQAGYESGEARYELLDPAALDVLAKEDPGDIFFDIEGFSFGVPGGIEYLFGYTAIDNGTEFHWLWADTREQERELFQSFMREILNRLERFPDAKIYHYANYEQAALRRLAERHEMFEVEVERLLGSDVFVDLFNVVKKALVISQESYSIKKLENYYSFDRVSEVKEAMGSMEYYDQYLTALQTDPVAAENLKRQVIAYNQDDCASTLALVRWLRSLVNRDV